MRLLCIEAERGEHGVALHPVAVDQRVEIRKIRRGAVIQEDRAQLVRLVFPGVVEVVFVVGPLHEGVGDLCVRQPQPAEHLRVDLLQGLHVHPREHLQIRVLRLLLFRVRLRGRLGRGQLCPGDGRGLGVALRALPVLRLPPEHAEQPDGQPRRQHHDQHDPHPTLHKQFSPFSSFVFSILSHSSPRFQLFLVGSAPKAPLEGELSAKQTERLSQICCGLSVSASPSHLPLEGRLWTRAPHGFPYEEKATAHAKAALPLAEPPGSYAVRRFLPAQVTRARPRVLKMART